MQNLYGWGICTQVGLNERAVYSPRTLSFIAFLMEKEGIEFIIGISMDKSYNKCE